MKFPNISDGQAVLKSPEEGRLVRPKYRKTQSRFPLRCFVIKVSISFPCLGQRTKCMPSSSHVIVTAFVYLDRSPLAPDLEYKKNSSSKPNQSYRQYPVDSLTRNCVPCLVKRGQKSYPVQQHIPVKAILVCTPSPHGIFIRNA